MSHFYQEKIVNYSANLLYNIIIDVESYPQFLPWCQFSQIVKQIDSSHFEADLTINFKGITHKYRSLVIGNFNEQQKAFKVDATAINGPFKKLETKWNVVYIDENISKISCEIDFEFSSLLIGKMLSGVFAIASQKMILAFEERAKSICNK